MTEAAPKKKARTKAVATTKATAPAPAPSQEQQVSNALLSAIQTGTLQPEQLHMVLDAQERILDRQAKQAYFADMALCQAEMPKTLKAKENKQTRSMYEDLGDLVETIKPVYTRHGFAVSFNSCGSSQEGWIGMKATVTHRDGWAEEFTYEVPVDNVGMKGEKNKTVIHGVSSSRSYMRRYLLREIFNLTTSEDVDNDGNLPELLLSEDQVIHIEDLLKESGADPRQFLKFAGADCVENIEAKYYHNCVSALEKKIASKDVPQ